MKLLVGLVSVVAMVSAGAVSGAAFPIASALSAQDPAAEKEYEKRFKRINRKDADALLELALWAKEKGLGLKSRYLLRRVLRLSPDNEKAHEALGHVKKDGKWLTKVKAAESASEPTIASSSGPGTRMSIELPDEEESRKKVSESIETYAKKSAQLRSDFADEIGIDEEDYSIVETPHALLCVKIDKDSTHQLGQIAEYVYRRLNWITFNKLDAKTFGSDKHVYFVVSKSSYEDMVRFIADRYPKFSDKDADYVIKETNSGGFSWTPGMPMHLGKGIQAVTSLVANGMGHHWLHWHARPAFMEVNIKTGRSEGAGRRGRGNLMAWLAEGVGLWGAVDAIGVNNFHRVTKSVYKNVGKAKKGEDTDRIAIVYEVVTGSLPKGSPARSFYQLTRTKLNALTDIDLAMSWSIVDYLVRERTGDWRKLIGHCHRIPSFRMAFLRTFGSQDENTELRILRTKTKNDRKLEKLYQTACGRFEARWKAWAAKEYQAQYDDPTIKTTEPPFQPIQVAADEDDDGGGKKKKRRRRRRK